MKINFIFVEDMYHKQYKSNYNDSTDTQKITPRIGETVYVNGRNGIVENIIYHFKDGMIPYIDVMIKDSIPIDDGIPTNSIE